MRDQLLVLPFGSQPKRKFFLTVFAILMASFAFLFAASPQVGAQAAPIKAEWNGNSIMHNQHEYTPIADAKAGDSHKLPVGSKIYAYTEPADSNSNNPTTKAHLIYFAPGADPTKATSATLVTYDLNGTTYSNPTGTTNLTLTPQAGTPSDNPSSCQVMGIGWIVCPVSTFLAKSMDWLFDVLSNFLTVQPLQSNPDNALYTGWSVMRNFANVSFVIGFLVVIYSQLSNMGLSNYGLKKMLPRLIIAAILVNVSYWICTIAVDISNILGYSIQDIFMNLRENIRGTNANFTASDIDQTWERVTGAILSGGALVTGGVIAVAVTGSIVGAIAMLLPLLVIVILAALVAIILMAIRQALITILVIIAPLAFVAFLLPNTEKYFEKWRGIFTTMLVLFPVFAVIFGGSQVAGTAIIQNANSVIMLLLGMATQVAPLFVLPFLIKFSGGLIGQIAGIANNKSKGLVDRTRNFAKEQADLRKSKVLAKPKARYYKRPLSAMVQNADNRRRKREGWQKANQDTADAKWANGREYSNIQQASMKAAQSKEKGELAAQARYEASKYTNAAMQQLDIDTRANRLNLDVSKARVEANWEELKAGDVRNAVTPEGLSVNGLANYMHTRNALANTVRNESLEAGIEARRTHSAQHEQQQNFAKALEANQALSQRAGGIDPSGAIKAQASATGEILKAGEADLDAGVKLLNYRALKNNTTLKALSGSIVTDVTAGRGTYSTGEIEAALEAQAQDGQVVAFENARMSTNIDQDMVSRVIARNAGTFKSKGGFHLQADPGLANVTVNVMNNARMGSLGDTPADNMKDLKFGWIQEVSRNIDSIIRDASPADLEKAYNNVYEALKNDRIRATIGDRLDEVQAIELALRNQGYRAKPPML